MAKKKKKKKKKAGGKQKITQIAFGYKIFDKSYYDSIIF